MVSHLLLIEDEPTLRHTLEAVLEFGGFTSDSVASAKEGLEHLGSRAYAAILLDLGLPDVDGAQLIRTIRAVSNIPILVVSGRQNDQVTTLDLGADDFVPKPFLPDELLARIRAVLRRHKAETSPLVLADGEADGERHPSFDDNMSKHLRAGTLEAKLFAYLQERPGQLVPMEELLDMLWGQNTDRGQNHLRVLVAKLRAKLVAEDEKAIIINEWGRGYRLTSSNGTRPF